MELMEMKSCGWIVVVGASRDAMRCDATQPRWRDKHASDNDKTKTAMQAMQAMQRMREDYSEELTGSLLSASHFDDLLRWS
jgi:hypothetical protein